MINERRKGEAQGNPNPNLYQLAKTAYGSEGAGAAACNSSDGEGTCVFHNVTLGDMDVNCTPGSPNCYGAPGIYGTGGVLSTSTSAYGPAYGASKGWNFATGIGSVNVYLLVTHWP